MVPFPCIFMEVLLGLVLSFLQPFFPYGPCQTLFS